VTPSYKRDIPNLDIATELCELIDIRSGYIMGIRSRNTHFPPDWR
ncbi:12881_t:CDS:1, partial [Cetraspora pellucida]